MFICRSFFFSFFFSSRRRHTRSLCDWSSECALPISAALATVTSSIAMDDSDVIPPAIATLLVTVARAADDLRLFHDTVAKRSEERRVGKECRSRWSPHQSRKEIYKNNIVLS